MLLAEKDYCRSKKELKTYSSNLIHSNNRTDKNDQRPEIVLFFDILKINFWRKIRFKNSKTDHNFKNRLADEADVKSRIFFDDTRLPYPPRDVNQRWIISGSNIGQNPNMIKAKKGSGWKPKSGEIRALRA